MKFLTVATAVVLSLIAKCLAQNNGTTTAVNGAVNNLLNSTLNSSCVSASCPGLSNSSTCPFAKDGSVNCTAINQTMAILASCIATKNPICNTTIDPKSIPGLNFSLQQFQGGVLTNIPCSFNTNSGSTSGLSQITQTIGQIVDNPLAGFWDGINKIADTVQSFIPKPITDAINSFVPQKPANPLASFMTNLTAYAIEATKQFCPNNA